MRIPYDTPRIHLYTRIRKSPYYHASRRHGVHSYTVGNRTYHPRHYDDPIAEYWALVERVTLWDVGVERQIELTGPDALPFADLLTPRDLSTLEVGQCRYVLLTDREGGIVNNPILLRPDEDRVWLSVADGDVLLWARGLATYAGMDVDIREADVAPVQVQGPYAKQVLSGLVGDEVLDLAYYRCGRFHIQDMDVIVSRTGYSGEVGYEIYLYNASAHAQRLWDAVLAAGAPYGITVIGPSQIRRVEAGILSYGSDMTVDTAPGQPYEFLNPYEVGLEWTVDLDQDTDFIGKAALQRIATTGVSRKVMGVELTHEPITGYIEEPLPITDEEDHRIGHVSSVFYSPRLDRNIAFALIPADRSDPGTKLSVHAPLREAAATVVPTPFVDPQKHIPKS